MGHSSSFLIGPSRLRSKQRKARLQMQRPENLRTYNLKACLSEDLEIFKHRSLRNRPGNLVSDVCLNLSLGIYRFGERRNLGWSWYRGTLEFIATEATGSNGFNLRQRAAYRRNRSLVVFSVQSFHPGISKMMAAAESAVPPSAEVDTLGFCGVFSWIRT